MDPLIRSNPLLAGRIVNSSMAGGIVMFAIVTVVFVHTGVVKTNSESAPSLLLALGAVALFGIIAYPLLRRSMLGKLRARFEERSTSEIDPAELAPTFHTLTLIGAAMAEGFGLFGTVVLLITGQWAALAAPIIALIALAFLYPTERRLARFTTTITNPPWP